MKVGTPFGPFPFEYRRIERRADGLAVVGLVAGIESSVLLEKTDLLVGGALVLGAFLVARVICRAGR